MSAREAAQPEQGALVAVRDLTVQFPVAAREWRSKGKQLLTAVDHLSFDVQRREALALVGESGCGKTTTGRTILGLYRPTTGSICFDGAETIGLSGNALQRFRRRVQMVFQDPYSSLNPRMNVEEIIEEPLRAHRVGSRRENRKRVGELLELVGLPAASGGRFPNAFSGGQRQRIGIARALALKPDLLIADEPVSALDVSVQAQIVNLLMDIQDELGLTLVVIAHDLAVVRHIATRVAVMYLGQIVELADRDAIFAQPLHPYTQALLAAVPIPDVDLERARTRTIVSGDVPSPIEPPSGCRFHTRCPYVMEHCRTVAPPLLETRDKRLVACHLVHPTQEGSTTA